MNVAHERRNRLLNALPVETLDRFAERLEVIDLEARKIMYDYDAPLEYAYFPENMVCSILSVMADGTAVETATVGNDGFIGMPLYFGTERIAAQAFCQVPGSAARMRAADFRDMLELPGARETLGKYVQSLFIQVAQSSGCNRVHSMVQRCARWLLQTHDRVGRDEFSLTQDFLAQMLGVRRATVNEAAGTLYDAGAITYRYGKVRIIDRPKLERASCECYAIITREYVRLVEGRELPNPLRGVPMSEHDHSVVKPPGRSE